MQSLEPANDDRKYVRSTGDVTYFEEVVARREVEEDYDSQTLESHGDTTSSSSASSTEDSEASREKDSEFCLFKKLRQVYREESYKFKNEIPNFPPLSDLRHCSLLLEKLVERESLNMVIVTLYPPSEGFCLHISTTDGNIFEDSRQPYSQGVLLDYIDNEELPTPFLQHWEESFPQIFYSGCVIAQVRDLRFDVPGQIRHVLLRPHTQSLINDVNTITMEDGGLKLEERLEVEAAVVNNIQGPLCLDPRPAAGFKRIQMHQARHHFAKTKYQDVVLKNSQYETARKRKVDLLAAPHSSALSNYIQKNKAKRSRYLSTIEVPKLPNPEPEIPDKVPGSEIAKEISARAKVIERPPDSSECIPQVMDQYIIENETPPSPPNTTYHIKLSIFRRPSNSEYLGQLYFDKEYKEGERNGASCRFSLGTEARAKNYVDQFLDVFTEKGRKSVRVTHLVPGQPAWGGANSGMNPPKGPCNVRNVNKQKPVAKVLPNKATQQVKVASKPVKENISSITTNGILPSIAASSSSHSNGNLVNGEVPSTPVSSPSSPQVVKTSIMSNPEITALANELSKAADQFQQKTAAAAAAAAAAAKFPSPPAPTASSPLPTTPTSTPSNTAILTLLNNGSPTNSQALNQLLNQQQQKLIAAGKVVRKPQATGGRLKATIQSFRTAEQSSSQQTNCSTSVLVPLSALATQQNIQQNINLTSALPTASAIKTLTPANTVRHIKQRSVHYISSIQTLPSNLTNVSSVRSINSDSTIQRLSGTKETQGASSSVGQTLPGSNLGSSMPSLSALLADTHSAEDPTPVDRISNSQSGSINFTSVQAIGSSVGSKQIAAKKTGNVSNALSLTSRGFIKAPQTCQQSATSAGEESSGERITGNTQSVNLASLQVSFPALIPVSLNVSTPHIVTTAQALSNVTAGGAQPIQLGVARRAGTATLTARSVITAPRHVLKVTPANSTSELQLALQKQPQVQYQQCIPQQIQPTASQIKHRRRSTADPKQ